MWLHLERPCNVHLVGKGEEFEWRIALMRSALGKLNLQQCTGLVQTESQRKQRDSLEIYFNDLGESLSCDVVMIKGEGTICVFDVSSLGH